MIYKGTHAVMDPVKRENRKLLVKIGFTCGNS